MAIEINDAKNFSPTGNAAIATAVGDLVIAYVLWTGATLYDPPAAGGTVPTWNLIGKTSQTGNVTSYSSQSLSVTCAWTIIDSASNTYGVWGSGIGYGIAVVVKGHRTTTPIAASAIGGAGTTNGDYTTLTVPAVTVEKTDGTSLLLSSVGYRAPVSRTFNSPPTGYQFQRDYFPFGGTTNLRVINKLTSTSDGSFDQTVSGAVAAYATSQIEIVAAADTPPATTNSTNFFAFL